jgi:uncharacterized protein (DUF305 family)
MRILAQSDVPSMAVGAGMGAGPGSSTMPNGSMMMGSCPSPVMTVDETAIYLMRGNELVKLDKNTFAILSRTSLPAVRGMSAGLGAGPGTTTGIDTMMVPGMSSYDIPSGAIITTVQPSTSAAYQRLQSLSGDQFDRNFLQAITNHYSGSIQYGALLRDRASDKDVRDFGKTFTRDRGQERNTFTKWARSWYNVNLAPVTTTDDIRVLSQAQGLSGRNLDVAVMRNLIFQLQQAQRLSLLAQERANHQELRDASTKMIAQQNREMAWLRTKLATAYGVQLPMASPL